jgi:hypothetical protein
MALTIDEIELKLKQGNTNFITNKGLLIKVKIQTSGIGGRYQAFIDTPYFITMLETPNTVDVEGPLSFYARIATDLYDVTKRVDDFYERKSNGKF